MQGVSAHDHDGVVYRYYTCSNARGKDKSCECKPIRKEFLEDTVQKYVTSLFTDEFIQNIAHRVADISATSPNTAGLASAKASLRKTKKVIDNLITAIENGIDAQLISPKIKQRK